MEPKYLNRYHPNTPETFWLRVARADPDACWIWQGSKRPQGYGQLSYQGRHTSAHRLAWTLTHGPIPDGLFVLHRCDNPPCVNPAHLFLGTTDDNMHDAFVKHRIRTPQHRELPWPLNLIREANAARAAAQVTSSQT